MTYTITDNHHNLILTLTSDEGVPPLLEVYKNDTESYNVYNPSTQSSPYTYIIPLSDYEVGDVLTKFLLVQSDSIYPWETSEGISILLDGEEIASNIHTNTYTITGGFKEASKHTIQAVYCGNDEYNLSATDKETFVIEQPSVDEEGDPVNDGAWKLTFVNSKLSSTVYGISTKIKFRLTKGNVPVPNRVVETVNPVTIVSHTTDSKGIVTIDSKDWAVGTYKIGAYFSDGETSKIVTSAYKSITVQKAPCSITMETGSFVKGDIIDFYVRYNDKYRLGDGEKIEVYLNGKSKTYNLDNSDLHFNCEKSGTYELKLVYKGNSSVGSKTFSTTITIPKETS